MFVALSRIAAGGVFLSVRLVVARHIRATERNELKSYEEIMNMLEAARTCSISVRGAWFHSTTRHDKLSGDQSNPTLFDDRSAGLPS